MVIAANVATVLLQQFGVVRSIGWRKYRSGTSRNPRYDCILEASNSFRSFDQSSHATALTCLEALITRDPTFSLAWPYLAGLYVREYLLALNTKHNSIPPLERALSAARRGIELNPSNARAYHLMMVVQFARKDIKNAIAAGEKAIALNPYDLVILADYGGWLILSGETEKGLAMMYRAAEGDAIRLDRNHFHMFVAKYLKGNLAEASVEAQQMTGRYNPWGFLARALVASAKGDMGTARVEYGHLVGLRSAWGDDPRGELTRIMPDHAIVERFTRDLTGAGLPQRR